MATFGAKRCQQYLARSQVHCAERAAARSPCCCASCEVSQRQLILVLSLFSPSPNSLIISCYLSSSNYFLITSHRKIVSMAVTFSVLDCLSESLSQLHPNDKSSDSPHIFGTRNIISFCTIHHSPPITPSSFTPVLRLSCFTNTSYILDNL